MTDGGLEGGRSQELYDEGRKKKTFLTLHFHFTSLAKAVGLLMMGLVQVSWVAVATWPTAGTVPCTGLRTLYTIHIKNPSRS